MFSLYRMVELANSKSYSVLCEHLSDISLSTLEIRAAQLRSVTAIAPKSPFSYVNRSPIQYSFFAGVKATWYSVTIAS